MPSILPPGFVTPCQPSSVKIPPIGGDWLHEIKHDGFRLMVQRAAGRVRLFARNASFRNDRGSNTSARARLSHR